MACTQCREVRGDLYTSVRRRDMAGVGHATWRGLSIMASRFSSVDQEAQARTREMTERAREIRRQRIGWR